MKRVSIVTAALALLLQDHVEARSWQSLEIMHNRNPSDSAGFFFVQEADPRYDYVPGVGLLSNVAPTTPPTLSPTREFSSVPTHAPSGGPSAFPSMDPSVSPSAAPTNIASSAPSVTPDPYPPTGAPSNPEPWYFDYDTSFNSNHGPGALALVPADGTFIVGIKNDKWGSVQRPPDFYWDEFTENGSGPWEGTLSSRDPRRNVCATGSMQSPIDVKDNGAICHEHHEVRSLPGDYRVNSDRVEKQIQSNKLRLKYERRPCADLNNVACQEPDPPYADFPEGWGGFADVMHIDFKVPGEHRIWGTRFDAEMQIYHLHADNRRMAAQAAMIQATEDGFNYYFDEALQAFQFQYDKNQDRCFLRRKRERQLVAEMHGILGVNVTSDIDYETWADYSTETDRPDYDKFLEEGERRLQSSSWDPHHEMLIPTIHFYRYEGSLTEPPCGEFVTWFIADRAMTISIDQLEQMKRILFTNVDDRCQKTSVQFEHSVARPVRPVNGRPVWRCTPADFGPDP